MNIENSNDVDRLAFRGRISQLLPGGRGGFVTFDEPLKLASRGFFRASLLDETRLAVGKTAQRVKGVALANGAVMAEIVELMADE